MKPTDEAYGEIQQAFDYMNMHLFSSQLPVVLFTFQRDPRTSGYFVAQRFVNPAGERVDEIAVNPAHFAVVPVMEVLQTIVHEMVHLWQSHFGKPGRRRYHNKQWSSKMQEIGLMPSDTGQPGGKTVGERMSDYVIEGGLFQQRAKELLAGQFGITWKDRYPERRLLANLVDMAGDDAAQAEALQALENMGVDLGAAGDERPPNSRPKYTCGCGVNVWGKPGLAIICGKCGEHFEQKS